MTPAPARYDAVMFDLLTALIDSWSLWNNVAGSESAGLAWRKEYLKLTYGAGPYRPYETIVAEAAAAAGLPPACAPTLARRWSELRSWPEVPAALEALKTRAKLAVVTNCSIDLGQAAARAVCKDFDVVVTAEEAGFYKPRREPYAMTLARLGTDPARTLFVAGSASDVPGAAALCMPVFWHNRIGLPPSPGAEPDFHEPTLARLTEIA